MKISVVTISFNQVHYLKQTIDSVLQQDYSDIEYIVVDPGSIDGSRELIESYKDRIKHIIFEPDQGPADGLNKGFDMATGDIFCFINSDDFLLPGALSIAASYFRKHPSISVVSGDALVVDGAGRTINTFRSRRFSLQMCAYGAATLAQQSTFFRASAFRKAGGFNRQNRVAWDGELWIDLARTGSRFGRIHRFLSGFRLYGETITGSGRFRAAYDAYTKSMFEKIMNRPWSTRDEYYRWAAKAVEYLTHPIILKDRLIRGPSIHQDPTTPN